MNIKTWEKKWNEYLPNCHKWLEQVEVSANKNEPKDGVLVVALKPIQKNNPENIEIDAPALNIALKEKIQKQANEHGYIGKGTLELQVDQLKIIALKKSELKVSNSQIGRQLGLDASSVLKNRKVKSVSLAKPSELNTLDLFDGLTQGYYSVGSFKGKSNPDDLNLFPQNITLLDESIQEQDIAEQRAFGEALMLTKWLEDSPPNFLTPERFAEIAEGISSKFKLKCKIHNREEITSLGMGCFASVAGGSKLEPQFIEIEIPGQDNEHTIALVGKGLTFDSGGISIKPSGGMGEMKYDMCGGASVLGAAYFLGQVKPKSKVVVLIGAVENMPGELATRPSDIVRAYNGKTVEILNTDAEGRLVMCDILAYANAIHKPSFMVDIATLTGAVLVALGSCGSAIISNNDRAQEFVFNLSKNIGEPAWPLPLWPELAKEMKSDVADLKNIPAANVKAGTITAGQYLREFVGDTPWVHLDIAGTGWSCKATGYPNNGGSGYGVKLLSHICHKFEALS